MNLGQKIEKLVCLTLTLCMLVCMVPLGVAYAADEITITSPAAGSFLEVGEAVTVCVASETAPVLTANGAEIANPTARGNGYWDFTWRPQNTGVVTFRATNGAYTDEINAFVGITNRIEISTAAEGSDTLLTPTGLDAAADVAILAFDVTFASAGDTLNVTHGSGAAICSLTATDAAGAYPAGVYSVKVVFDRALAKQSTFVEGIQIGQEDMLSTDIGLIRFSGAAVSNLAMRQSADPGVSITSPAANTKVFVGDSLEVKVKTAGLTEGQAVKVVAKDGSVAVAEPVPGSADEYAATFERVTEGFQTLTAIIEAEGLKSNEIPLTLLQDTLLKSWDFNEGTVDTAGNLDAAEALFWNDDFIYKTGKAGEGLAAYRQAPTSGAWQGDGLVVNFKAIPNSGRVTFVYDARMDGKVSLRIRNSSGTYTDALSFNGTGNIWNSLGQITVSQGYLPETWQKHKLVFDMDNQTVDFYVDDVIKVEKQAASQLAGVNALAMVTWAVNRSDTGGVATYMDNLQVYTTQEVGTSDDGGGVAGSVAFVSPSPDAFVEQGRPITLKVHASGTDSVDFYANGKRIGSAAVTNGVAAYIWTPDTEGAITLTAASGTALDEMLVEVVAAEEFYYDAFNGSKIIETDNINTWGGLQNFDRYQSGGPDGGKYGVMTGSGANKYILFNCPEPKNPGIYIVEMNVRFPAGAPASIGLGNYHDTLGSNEMFYIGTAGSGYHDSEGTWISTENLPADAWVNIKYIENIDEAVRTIYINGVELYSGPARQTAHTTFGGLSFSMNKNWTNTHEFHVDNLRISTAAAPLFARSATMQDSNTIRVQFSKAVSLQNLESSIQVFRGETEVEATFAKGDKYLDLTMQGLSAGTLSTEYTVVIHETLTAEDGMPLKKAETFTVRSAGQSANVSDIGWKTGSQMIASLNGLNAGDEITFSCNVTGSASAARVILCLYTKNANGSVTLKQSAVSKTSLTANAATPVSAAFTLDTSIGTNDYLKVMILDADTFVPLADPVMLGAN